MSRIVEEISFQAKLPRKATKSANFVEIRLHYFFTILYVCDKNQKPLIDYFIQGRHKNCSVIYLTQSFYGCPKPIRLNCSHFCLYDFPSSRERNLISQELGIDKEKYIKATKKPYSFCYVDKPMKKVKMNFYGNI